MIKRYNQFVNEKINESDDFGEFEETDNQQEFDLANADLESEMADFEEEEMEEEGGDVYSSKLKEVADRLETEVVDGKVMYDGKKIIFPSETEMYHVGNKKFKTADEVVSFLEGGSNRESDREVAEMDEDVKYSAMEESKRYKNTRKGYKNTRKFK